MKRWVIKLRVNESMTQVINFDSSITIATHSYNKEQNLVQGEPTSTNLMSKHDGILTLLIVLADQNILNIINDTEINKSYNFSGYMIKTLFYYLSILSQYVLRVRVLKF